ncbi:MAG TPA: arginine N-succinyltransferase [Polyangiaceae bacterium]
MVDTYLRMLRYEIRGATSSDETELITLAAFLNTVNLPHDREHVRALLEHSEKSYRGELGKSHRKYVFLLRDLERNCAVGTSMIIAQLGRRDAPYIYLDVIGEEQYSKTLDRHFHHTLLRIGFSYQGPTEIGGLVVDPKYRSAPEHLGLLISYVRFLYIAMHRELFRDEILAELLPPLEPDGTSHLWEALGRRFTGMSYAEADLLSSTDKTFIRDLFPSGDIYATLLSPEAQGVIGKVGAQTRGVERMLRRVGFRYAERIDSFDGGPHFVAPVEEISLVGTTSKRRVASLRAPKPGSPRALLGVDLDTPPYFRAVASEIELGAEDTIAIPTTVAAHLSVAVGSLVAVLPLP